SRNLLVSCLDLNNSVSRSLSLVSGDGLKGGPMGDCKALGGVVWAPFTTSVDITPAAAPITATIIACIAFILATRTCLSGNFSGTLSYEEDRGGTRGRERRSLPSIL